MKKAPDVGPEPFPGGHRDQLLMISKMMPVAIAAIR